MEIIAAWFGKIVGTKLGVAGASALLGALAVKAPALLRPLFGKAIKSKLDDLLNPNLADPEEKEKLRVMVVAIMSYVEHKMPDRGRGSDKKQAVVAVLSKFLPHFAAQTLGDIVQEAFDSLDDSLRERLGINQKK